MISEKGEEEVGRWNDESPIHIGIGLGVKDTICGMPAVGEGVNARVADPTLDRHMIEDDGLICAQCYDDWVAVGMPYNFDLIGEDR